MKYSLDEFLELNHDDKVEYWNALEEFVAYAHMTYCAEAIEANTDSSIGSGRIPQIVSCDCEVRKL